MQQTSHSGGCVVMMLLSFYQYVVCTVFTEKEDAPDLR
jgi:hypothetical protein